MDFFFDNGIELKRRKIVDDLNVTENLFGCGQSLRFSIFFQNEWKARENDAFEAKVWNETFGSRRVADVAIWKCNSPDEWNRWPRFPLARSRRPLADQKEPVLVYLYANEPYTPGGKNTPFLATQKGPSRLQVGGSFPVGSFFSTWTHLSGSFSVFFFLATISYLISFVTCELINWNKFSVNGQLLWKFQPEKVLAVIGEPVDDLKGFKLNWMEFDCLAVCLLNDWSRLVWWMKFQPEKVLAVFGEAVDEGFQLNWMEFDCLDVCLLNDCKIRTDLTCRNVVVGRITVTFPRNLIFSLAVIRFSTENFKGFRSNFFFVFTCPPWTAFRCAFQL